jgi:hypothetical protein
VSLFIQINSVHIHTNYFPKVEEKLEVKVKVQLSLRMPRWPVGQCSPTSTQPYYRNLMQLSGSVAGHSRFVPCNSTPLHTCRESCVRPRAGLKAWKKQISLPYIDARHLGCPARSEATTPMHQMEMRCKLHTLATLLQEVESAVSMGSNLVFPKVVSQYCPLVLAR